MVDITTWMYMMHKDHIKIKQLDLDLDRLKRDCRRINNKVTKSLGDTVGTASTRKVYDEVLKQQLEQAPVSSSLHDYYNVFTFPYDGIRELYANIVSFFKETCDYDEPYYIHSWLNYQHKGESIPKHYHWKKLSGLDHTYVCSYYINAEPSVTTYEFDNGFIDKQHNKNNTVSLYEDVGDIHGTDVWQQDEPRIVISMDMVPMKYIQGAPFLINTWMPIL